MELREKSQPNKTLQEDRISFQGKSITAVPKAKIIFDEEDDNDGKSSSHSKQLATAAGLTKEYPNDFFAKEEDRESDQNICINGTKTGKRVTSSFPKKKKYRNKRSIRQRHPTNHRTRSSSLPTISEEEVPAVFFRGDSNELPPLVGGTDKSYDYYRLPNNLFGNSLEDDLEDDLGDIAF